MAEVYHPVAAAVSAVSVKDVARVQVRLHPSVDAVPLTGIYGTL